MEHLWFKDALYLIRPKGSCLLWTAEIWRFHYGRQLIRLNCALREKRPKYEQRHDKVILLHNNARPHVAKVVKKYLETLKWDVLLHPYSPDIALSFFLLLLVVPKDAASHWFTSFAEIENWLQNWIVLKDESLFREGIRKLPERWGKVDSDRQYFNWSVHSFCFEINAFLNTKKRTELICSPNII